LRNVTLHLEAFAITDVGKIRELNEDGFLASFLDGSAEVHLAGDPRARGVILAAIDGTGGASSGDHAVELATRTILADLQYERAALRASVESCAHRLAVAIEHASLTIFRNGTEHPEHRGAGCTATVASLCGRSLVIAHVGETRAYVLRAGNLVQVTRDHTLANAYIDAGRTPEELEEFEPMNVVLQALGTGPDVRPTLLQVELSRDDVILLCTDGLWSVVAQAPMARALGARSPRAACEALLREAQAVGAPDNVTVVVARVSGAELPAPGRESVRVAPIGSPE
jgi:serine/threonine protein phosphatase PrpC